VRRKQKTQNPLPLLIRAAPERRAVLARARKPPKTGSGLAVSVNDSTMMRLFLRQSMRSNYCGVYSCAMLLARLGYRIDRCKAFSLFGLPARPRAYEGASLSEIAATFTAATGNVAKWRMIDTFSYTRLTRLVKNRAPTLLAFGARYARFRCVHVVLAVGVGGEGLELVDPLGRHPGTDGDMNAVLRADGSMGGVLYRVVTSSPFAVLEWR
jgi:hypothetical protein